MPNRKSLFLCWMTIWVSTALAGNPSNAGDGTSESSGDAIELFQGITDGEIDVRFIPIDEKRANVLIQNKTELPIQIQLPNAIAAVPVLAQFNLPVGGQQAGGQQAGGQQAGGGGASQGVGGGFDQGGGGGQRGFGGQQNNQQGGFFRIAPNKTRKIKAITVCLEHGKPNPNPRIAYKMIPITKYTKDKRIISLCEDLGSRSIDQKTGQAVAWHLANELGWKALAKINQIESRYLGNVPFFQKTQLKKAKAYVEELNEEPVSTLYAN